jgi:hypothetical protein
MIGFDDVIEISGDSFVRESAKTQVFVDHKGTKEIINKRAAYLTSKLLMTIIIVIR